MRVASRQGGDIAYMDLEEDGNLLLESLWAQFEGATGLRYPFESGYRSVRVRNGTLLRPKAGWQETVYFVVLNTITTGESLASGATAGGSRRNSDVKVEAAAAAVDTPPVNGGEPSTSNVVCRQETKDTASKFINI